MPTGTSTSSLIRQGATAIPTKTFEAMTLASAVLGRSVATLVKRHLEPGLHTVAWNGSTSVGREASSGMYFYRLTAGHRVESRKMVLLK